MSETGTAIPVGGKVRVHNFPPNQNGFDWNGLVGVVKRADKVGLGLNNKSVYAYEVFFENVDVPFANKNPQTNKIDRGVTRTNAQNYFEEIFLERIHDANPAV